MINALEVLRGDVAHAPILAALHQEAFAAPWTTQSFIDLLKQPNVQAWITHPENPTGFVLTRLAADEVEVLTLAVRPDKRRKGFARVLLQTALSAATDSGAAVCHLEVADDNEAAQALYTAAGFSVSGRRPAYYDRPDGAVDAVLMIKNLK